MRAFFTDKWALGLVVGFVVVVVVNFGFIYVAVSGADAVEQSYLDDPR